MEFVLDPDVILRAYACGLFPMAECRDDLRIYWVDPDLRGIIPLDGLRVSRRLARRVRRDEFEIRTDTAFRRVMEHCAESTPERAETWINDQILTLYEQLHRRGAAHSIECWRDEELVGGLYGVVLGGAFFGESMFTRATDASKVALVELVNRLNRGGFHLLDTQFITPHLLTLGAIEIPRDRYQVLLRDALAIDARFYSPDKDGGAAIIQPAVSSKGSGLSF
ncbi:MAG: leucyl/phenylalanyl-tRNA--protein transferase [Alphaproteobacteria bacterium]